MAANVKRGQAPGHLGKSRLTVWYYARKAAKGSQGALLWRAKFHLKHLQPDE